jgi:hypothetical protein
MAVTMKDALFCDVAPWGSSYNRPIDQSEERVYSIFRAENIGILVTADTVYS